MIEAPRPLLRHLGELPPGGARLILEPSATGSDPAGGIADPGGSAAAVEIRATVELAVGPEGGFEAEELEAFRISGFTSVALGPRVLRTETAAIAGIAWLQSRFGDLAVVPRAAGEPLMRGRYRAFGPRHIPFVDRSAVISAAGNGLLIR